MSKYVYLEMGSRNKKTGKLPKYKVIVQDNKISDCDCLQEDSENIHLVNIC